MLASGDKGRGILLLVDLPGVQACACALHVSTFSAMLRACGSSVLSCLISSSVPEQRNGRPRVFIALLSYCCHGQSRHRFQELQNTTWFNAVSSCLRFRTANVMFSIVTRQQITPPRTGEGRDVISSYEYMLQSLIWPHALEI